MLVDGWFVWNVNCVCFFRRLCGFVLCVWFFGGLVGM